MHVKAFAALTQHWRPIEHLQADLSFLVGKTVGRIFGRDLPGEVLEECWRRFLGFVHPLKGAGKLGYLLFQFPPWFRPGVESYRYLEEVASRTQGYLVATEFRHPAWYVKWAEVKSLMTELGMVHATVDGPRLLEVPDTVAEATHPGCAVLRLHGRNAQTWNIHSGKASDRFNYWYSRDELRGLLEVARRLEEQTELVWVIFNNNYDTQSVDGARGLLELLHVKDLGEPSNRIHASAT